MPVSIIEIEPSDDEEGVAEKKMRKDLINRMYDGSFMQLWSFGETKG